MCGYAVTAQVETGNTALTVAPRATAWVFLRCSFTVFTDGAMQCARPSQSLSRPQRGSIDRCLVLAADINFVGGAPSPMSARPRMHYVNNNANFANASAKRP
jgi:hypothetical protein